MCLVFVCAESAPPPLNKRILFRSTKHITCKVFALSLTSRRKSNHSFRQRRDSHSITQSLSLSLSKATIVVVHSKVARQRHGQGQGRSWPFVWPNGGIDVQHTNGANLSDSHQTYATYLYMYVCGFSQSNNAASKWARDWPEETMAPSWAGAKFEPAGSGWLERARQWDNDMQI